MLGQWVRELGGPGPVYLCSPSAASQRVSELVEEQVTSSVTTGPWCFVYMRASCVGFHSWKAESVLFALWLC